MLVWGRLTYLLMVLAAAAAAQADLDHPVLNEFLANPTVGLETEWVELYNPSVFAVDLQDFKLGDALGWREISDTPLVLVPGEYVVLAQDAGRFLEHYSDFSGHVVSPNGWQVLNNDGDVVRLGDNNGATIDSIIYDDAFPENRSWERYCDDDGRSFWGGAFDPSGSTPGCPNSYFYPRPTGIDLEVSPDPFSPDGDGFEDFVVIKYDLPESGSFDLAIYDVAGRRVKTFVDEGQPLPGEIVWDGRDQGGRKLPVGIYIILARLSENKAQIVKRTVVIAR